MFRGNKKRKDLYTSSLIKYLITMYQKTMKMRKASRVPAQPYSLKPTLDIDRSFYSLSPAIQNWIMGNTLNIFKLLRNLDLIVFSPKISQPFLYENIKTLYIPLDIKQEIEVHAQRHSNFIHIFVVPVTAKSSQKQ